MEAVGAYSRLLAKKSGKRSDEAVLCRRREAFRRRRKFITKQRQQQVAFLFVISIAVLHIHSPIRSVQRAKQLLVGADSTADVHNTGLA